MFLMVSLQVFAADQNMSNEQSIVDPTMLHVALTLEPNSLDPTTDASAVIQRITYQNIFEGLTQISESGEVLPSLARYWVISNDGLTYTFTLQKNVYFHNKVLLTADIVKQSLLRMSDFDSKNPLKDKFQHIKRIELLEGGELQIALAWPDPYLLYNLALGNAVIQEPSSIAHNQFHPIGTGPYKLEKWEKGLFLTLKSHSEYWQTLPPIKQVKITFTPTRAEMISLLAESGIDGFDNITEMSFLDALFSIQPRYEQVFGDTQGEIIIAFNHKNPLLASLPVRQAISYAIDKEKIIATPNFNTGDKISSFFPPYQAASLPLSEGYSFNLKKAKSLMANNIIEIKPLRLLVPPPIYARYMSLHIKQMLEKINIPIVIEHVTWAEWVEKVYVDRNYDLSVIAHIEPNDLEIYAKDNYYFNYKNVEYEDLMAKLSKTLDADSRIPLQLEAQRLLVKDAASVFLFMLPKMGVWDNRLQGYWVNEPLPALIFSKIFWLNDINRQ